MRTANRADILDNPLTLPALHLPLLLPLASALLYAAAAVCLKIALGRGATSWQVLFHSNFVLGVIFLPLALFGHEAWNFAALPWAMLAGFLFFLGQIGTFRSLQSGDVSIATPALASKVVFVALLSLLLVPDGRPDPDLWLAVILTMVGVVLLHRGPRHPASHPLPTLAWALFAALAFAATDILVQVHAPEAGFTLFMPAMFVTVAVISLPLLHPRLLNPKKARPSRPGMAAWLGAGVLLLGLQATGMATAIGLFGDATGANVVYSSRGLWSLLILGLLARRLGLTDSVGDRGTLASRILGSILILTAVALVLF